MKFVFSILLLVLFSATILSQESYRKTANWWYFGENAGLNFNVTQTLYGISGLPTPVNGPVSTNEGCFTISDVNGNHLLSGDGINVYGRDNVLIESALGGGRSSTQSGIIIPVPEKANLYYVISVAQERGTGGIKYSQFNISAGPTTTGGPRGAIVSRNVALLAAPKDENISAVKATSGDFHWLVNITQNNTIIGVTSLSTATCTVARSTSAGIQVNSTQTFNYTPVDINGFFEGTSLSLGTLKFSSDGKRFARVVSGLKSIFWGEFDPYEGVITNFGYTPVGDLFGPQIYAVEFSPNGENLYFTDSNNSSALSSQWTWEGLKANDLSQVTKFPYFASNFQLAPDGRIYGIAYQTKNLIVIQNPNIKGSGCSMVQIPNYLTKYPIFGLPNFVSTFYNLESEKTKACRGGENEFSISAYAFGSNANSVSRLDWDWGDGSTTSQNITIGSKNYSAKHQYNVDGNYTITVKMYNNLSEFLASTSFVVQVSECLIRLNPNVRFNLN